MAEFIMAEELSAEEREKLTAEILESTSDNTDSLIVVTQLPVIQEQLLGIKEHFEAEVRDARSLACTEETLQTVKKRRAALTKIFKALEEKRKEAKKAILSPYEEFEEIYKECVTNIYKPCDEELAAKIAEVENGLKAQKRDDAEAYFNEYCASKDIDFLTLDNTGVSITLSTSRKSIHTTIKTFIDKVCDELALINTQEHSAEILVEYKKSLNVAQAIKLVIDRHKAMEEEQQRLEAKRAREAEQNKAVEKVEEAAEAISAPIGTAITEDDVEAVSAACATAGITTDEALEAATASKLYEVTFTVKGRLDEIKALKSFLEEGGYQYEQQ